MSHHACDNHDILARKRSEGELLCTLPADDDWPENIQIPLTYPRFLILPEELPLRQGLCYQIAMLRLDLAHIMCDSLTSDAVFIIEKGEMPMTYYRGLP